MNNPNLKPVHELRTEAPPAFSPQTMIVPAAEGIQVIVPFAPQVSMIVVLSLEQLKAAMEQCLQLRVQQNLAGGRRDLKPV